MINTPFKLSFFTDANDWCCAVYKLDDITVHMTYEKDLYIRLDIWKGTESKEKIALNQADIDVLLDRFQCLIEETYERVNMNAIPIAFDEEEEKKIKIDLRLKAYKILRRCKIIGKSPTIINRSKFFNSKLNGEEDTEL